jgi:hypothetical protein
MLVDGQVWVGRAKFGCASLHCQCGVLMRWSWRKHAVHSNVQDQLAGSWHHCTNQKQCTVKSYRRKMQPFMHVKVRLCCPPNRPTSTCVKGCISVTSFDRVILAFTCGMAFPHQSFPGAPARHCSQLIQSSSSPSVPPLSNPIHPLPNRRATTWTAPSTTPSAPLRRPPPLPPPLVPA